MSRTSRWGLFTEWFDLRFPRFTRFLIIILGIGAYPPTPALIAKTQEVWAKRLGREVSEQEALRIIREFRNLLSLLKEIRHGK